MNSRENKGEKQNLHVTLGLSEPGRCGGQERECQQTAFILVFLQLGPPGKRDPGPAQHTSTLRMQEHGAVMGWGWQFPSWWFQMPTLWFHLWLGEGQAGTLASFTDRAAWEDCSFVLEKSLSLGTVEALNISLSLRRKVPQDWRRN